MRTRLTSIIWLVMLLVLPGTVLASPFYVGSSPLVPPPDGVYLTPQQVHAEYMDGALDIILRDIRHSGFTNINRTPSSGNTFETFNSTVMGNVSVNNSPFQPISLSGPVAVELFNYTPNNTGTFNTEMTQLDLSNGSVMIRESPTLSSLGTTTITDIGGGQFRIDSFFDIFTELSLDGGNSWTPSTGSTHVDLANTPLPSTWLMLLSGFIGLGYFVYRGSKKRTAVLAAA